jgi:hypothetical protein
MELNSNITKNKVSLHTNKKLIRCSRLRPNGSQSTTTNHVVDRNLSKISPKCKLQTTNGTHGSRKNPRLDTNRAQISIIECVARHKPTRNHKLDTNGLQKLNYGVRTITYPDSLVSPNKISLCKKMHNIIT